MLPVLEVVTVSKLQHSLHGLKHEGTRSKIYIIIHTVYKYT